MNFDSDKLKILKPLSWYLWDGNVTIIAIFLKVRVMSYVIVDNGHECWNIQVNCQEGKEI